MQRKLSIILWSLLVLLIPVSGAVAQAYEKRQVSPQATMPASPAEPQFDRAATPASNAVLELSFTFPQRHSVEIDALIHRQNDPHSPDYRRFLTPAEFGRRFGAPEKDVQAVLEFIHRQGMRVKTVWPNRMCITAEATVAQAEAAFNLRIKGYHRTEREIASGASPTFYAPDRAITLPQEIASCLQSVTGMSTQRWHAPLHRSTSRVNPFTSLMPSWDALNDPNGLLPNDLASYYNLLPLRTLLLGHVGEGYKIGVVSYTRIDDRNISEFCAQIGIENAVAAGRIVHSPDSTHPPRDSNNESEVVLDIETILGQAPKATIIVYEIDQNADDTVLYQRMLLDAVTVGVISNSWGSAETKLNNLVNIALVQNQNNALQQMMAQGQAFYTGSGDGGAYDQGAPYSKSAVFPASSPYVTAVGATSTSDGFTEAAMEYTPPPAPNTSGIAPWGSGGGLSIFFPRPAWQDGPGVLKSGISNGKRQVPDISSLGGTPGIRFWYKAPRDDGHGNIINLPGAWYKAKGTSVSTPFWAASHLLISQAISLQTSQSGFRTGSLNPMLYALAAKFPTTIPDEGNNFIHYAFNDIISGTNGAFNCTPAWDFVTGLGSADMNKLLLDLGQTYYNHITADMMPYARPGGALFGDLDYPVQLHPLPYDVTEPITFNNATDYYISVGMTNNGQADAEPGNYSIQVDGVDHLFKMELTDGTPLPIPGVTPEGNNFLFYPVNPYVTRFTAGTHTLKLIVNPDGKIKETNSANNTYTRTITVLDVTTPVVGAVSLIPSTVIGNSQNSTGTVILTARATNNTVVTLSSSDTMAATVPASVTVPLGAISASFTVTPLNVTATKSVDITAAANGVSRKGTLTVNPLVVSRMILAPGSVTGGSQTIAGTIKLNGKPKTDITVTLSSSNTAAATVPATVIVPANQDTATFTVSTLVVSTAQSLTITADYNGYPVHASITVSPVQTLSSLTLHPDTVYGGQKSSTGTVTLTAPAVAPVQVYLFTSDDIASTPGTVTIPAGAMSADFAIPTKPVEETHIVGVYAYYNGVTVAAELTVNPLTVETVTLVPDTVRGSTTVTGTVTLNGIPIDDVTVTLTSSNTGAATVPATVVVPAGSTSATFTATTYDAPLTQTSLITATLNNIGQSALLTVNPLLPAFAPASLTLSPTVVLGGSQNSTATVTLTATVTFPVTLTLSSSDTTAATVPASITFSGQSATFPVTTLAVTTTKTPVISASVNGVTKSATLTVVPPAGLASITIPALLISGQSSTGTVSLTVPTATAVTVNLSNSNASAVTVPASVTIPVGASSAPFTITAGSVTTSQLATITATLNGVSKSASVTVNPPPVLPVPIGLSLNPASVVGGQQNSTATITLSSAPTAAVLVSLSSSDTTAATVPASVSVTAGATTATFTVTSLGVSTVKTPTITATANGGSQSATLTVNPKPTLTSFTINPTSVIGGLPNLYPVTGTVTLSTAPASAVTVWIASNSVMATAQSMVTVPAGATSATFPINTYSNNQSYAFTVTFYASLDPSVNPFTSLTAQLTLLPTPSTPLLSYCFLSGGPLVGGQENGAGSVSINQVAPAGGVVVALTSSDTTAATVPATVTIPQGASSVQFPLTTLPVTSTKTVFVSAALNGSRLNSNVISIIPAPDFTLSVSPTTVIGSINGTATITLASSINKNVPVTVSSDNPNLTISTPNTTVPYYTTSTNVFWSVVPVTSPQTATITATVYGKSKSATVTLQPVSTLTGLSLDPTTIIGGVEASTGTVTVNIPTSLGASISLSSDDPDLVLPSSAFVSTGMTSTTFTVTHSEVTVPTTAHITATCNGTSQTATLNIQPKPTLTSLTVAPDTVVGGAQTSTGTVTLSGAYPAGVFVTLTSTDSNAASIPPTIYVPSGATSTTFTIYTGSVTAVTTPTITATLDSITQTASLTVLPTSAFALASLTVSPTAVVGGVGNSTGTVKLKSIAVYPVNVNLSTSDTTAATVPASVTIPVGSIKATFPITSLPVSTTKSVGVYADTGFSSKSATLSVRPPAVLSGLTLAPTSVLGGAGNAKGTLTLTAATISTLTVTLKSSDITVATVPASVTFAANTASLTFTVTSKKVTTTKMVTITATCKGVSYSAVLTVQPAPTLVSLVLSPTSVHGGFANSTGTVTLSSAPVLPATITLTSSDTTAAKVPTSVIVAAGSTTATFTVTSKKVTVNKTTTIKASFGGVSKSAILTVTH